MAENLKNQQEVDLAIASPYAGNSAKKYYDGKVTYYLFPNISDFKYNRNLDRFSKAIIEEFQPDIIHIHGTEYAHGLSFLNTSKDNIKKVVSIQGLTKSISKLYLEGIERKDIIKNITFRDIIKRDSIFQQKNKFTKRALYENEIIKKSDYIIGRTDWDKYNTKAINDSAKYFYLPEVIRKGFYENRWDINKVQRYSIYLSQSSYTIKGLHKLLEALKVVKNTYPDVKLYISGLNILNRKTIIDKIKFSGYGKYIKSLVKNYNLENNIEFTGILQENEVIERLLKTHVVVVPSVVENESNSLTEAHLLGMPTVAAFSGGMTDRIVHKKTGFLYPFYETHMCAGYIMEYFNNDELAKEYGENARNIAVTRNDPKSNVDKLLDIYNEIIKGE